MKEFNSNPNNEIINQPQFYHESITKFIKKIEYIVKKKEQQPNFI